MQYVLLLLAALIGQPPQGVMYHAPRWSPDGKHIAIVALSGNDGQVLVYPAEGGKPTRVAVEGLNPMAADWTQSGELIVSGPLGNDQRWIIVRRDGSNARPTNPDSVRSALPDSSLLLFEGNRGATQDVVITDRGRSRVRRLTSGFWTEQPSLSPDGRLIVFEKRMNPMAIEQSEVVIMATDGSGQTTIAAGTDPSWSRDGKSILFKAFDEQGKLWISLVDPTTRTIRRLARGVHPQWSPDGRRIVFMLDQSDASHVYVMRSDGTGQRCLTCQ